MDWMIFLAAALLVAASGVGVCSPQWLSPWRRFAHPASGVVALTRLPENDAMLGEEVVRFHPMWIDASKRNPACYRRRQPIILENPDTGAWTLRYAAGGVGIKAREAATDYDAFDALGIRHGDHRVCVRPAASWQVLDHHLRHPRMVVRLSTRLGLLGAVLGALGVISSLLR